MSLYIEGSEPFDPSTLFDNLCWYLEDYSRLCTEIGFSGNYETTYIEAKQGYVTQSPAYASFSVSFVYSEDIPIEVRWYVDDKQLQTVDPITFDWIDRVDTAVNNYSFSEHIDFEISIGSHYVHCVVTVFGQSYTSPKLEVKVVGDIPHETPSISTIGADAVYRMDAEEVSELKAIAMVGDGGFLCGEWLYKKEEEIAFHAASEDIWGHDTVSLAFTPKIDKPGTYEYAFRAMNYSPIDDCSSCNSITSETFTITVLPPFDLPSFQLGIAVGLGLKGFGYMHEGKQEPIAYLYNGVRLPKLPEWDREAYPFAVIGDHGLNYPSALYVLSADAYYKLNGNQLWLFASAGLQWEADDGKWSASGENAGDTINVLINSTSFASTYELIWTNFDAEYNGTLYLSASEPVPIYE